MARARIPTLDDESVPLRRTLRALYLDTFDCELPEEMQITEILWELERALHLPELEVLPPDA